MKFLFICLFISLSGFTAEKLSRVKEMADLPKPYKIIDFKKIALEFDKKVYNFNEKGQYWPLIWIDDKRDNYDQETFGIYTTLGDIRQGKHHNEGTFHESLNSMGSVLGATLVGIDKTKQNRNFVSMLKNYFNRDNGWMIFQNNTNPKAGSQGGGYGRDWWYDVFPNVLFYAIYDKYPEEHEFKDLAVTVAEKFLAADAILNGNYKYSFFNYNTMRPVTNWICPQADVAAGHSWVLYSAYKKFKDSRYLDGAVSSLKALESNKINPSYELLMPFGALMAARLNAEEGMAFDVQKLLEWTLNGDAVCREGWGVLTGNWNGFDISGLVGSTVDHGGYGFVMNTFDMAWPVVPLVRYDQRYAYDIGKWMLNAANAVKLAYPDHAPIEHQTIPELAKHAKGVIAYEGVIKRSNLPEYRNQMDAPIAQGDGPLWIKGNPAVTQLSVYGSGHVGIFGSIIEETNVKGILKLDLLATDFFREKAYPTYLLTNTHNKTKTVTLKLPAGEFDLYDAVTGTFMKRHVTGSSSIVIDAKSAVVAVIVPANGKIEVKGHKTYVNGVVINYRTKM